MSRFISWKRSVCLALALCMILPATWASASESSSDAARSAASKLKQLKVVQGDENGDLLLNSNLTRAELVTIIVRSFGQDQNAKLVNGAPSFYDVQADAWYSGYVAVAKNLAERAGSTLGYPDGKFNPNQNVSSAEALVFIMKFMGVKVEPTGPNWYDPWIQKAVEMGLISQEEAAATYASPNNATTRAEFFIALDHTFSAKLLNGKSVFQTYLDNVPPGLEITLPSETFEPFLSVSGTASGASEVRINTNPVTPGANGAFAYRLYLDPGVKNTVQIWATDAAGNTTSQTFEVLHRFGDPALIEAEDVTLPAGDSTDLDIVVKDQYGNVLPETYAAVSVQSILGTYLKGVFTAGRQIGSGTATITASNTMKSVSKMIRVNVTAASIAKIEADKAGVAPGERLLLKAVDPFGNVINDSVTWSQTSADAVLDGDTGVFIGTKPGNFTVTAKRGDKTVTGTAVVYGAPVKLELSAPSTLEEGQSGVISGKAVDANGNVVASYNGALTVYNPNSGVSVSAAEIKNGILSGSVYAVYPGTFSFDIRTNDNKLKSDMLGVTVTAKPYVPPANHAPVWMTIPDQLYDEVTDPYSIDLSAYASDPDGDPLTFTLAGAAPAGSSIIGTRLEILVPNDPGTYHYTVIASDGSLSKSISFNWEVKDIGP